MANTFSTISLVSFVLAGLFLAAAVVLFFVLDVRAVYRELKGQPEKQWVSNKDNNKITKSVRETPTSVRETPTSKTDVEDEAVTTLDNGEEVKDNSLMSVYEPGTDLMDDIATDEVTEIQTSLEELFDSSEVTTELEDQSWDKDFVVTKRKILIHSNEILR